MADVKTSLSLVDRFSPALAKINASVNSTIRNFSSLNSASSKSNTGALDDIAKSSSKASGALSSVGSAMSGVANTAAGVGSKLGSAISSGAATAAGAINSLAVAGSATVAALVGGIGALAVTGGYTRAMDIEKAKAKLRGLGNDANTVASIIQSASDSVTGTPFGLDEAAGAAAGAKAAGIGAGESMTRYLTLAANAAAAMGVSMGESGVIMNKVAAQGYASMQELNMVTERQIPIMGTLAKTMGKSMEDVKKAAANGEISLQDFMTALEKASGTVAEEMGKTLPGSLMNLKASIKKVGADFWASMSPGILNTSNSLKDLVNIAQNKLKPTFEHVGESFSNMMDPINAKVTAFKAEVSAPQQPGQPTATAGAVQTISTKLGVDLGGTEAVAPAMAAMSAAMLPLLGQIPKVGFAFRLVPAPIALVVGAIAGLMAISPELREAMGNAFSTLAPLVSNIFGQIGSSVDGFIPTLMQFLSMVASVLAQVVTAVTPFIASFIAGVVPAIQKVIAFLVPLVSTIISQLVPVIGNLVTSLSPLVMQLVGAVVPAFRAVVKAILPFVMQLASVLIPLITRVIQAIAPLIVQIASILIPIITQVIQAVMPLITMIISMLIPVVMQIIAVLTPVIEAIIQIVQGLMPLISAIMSLVSTIVSFLMPVITFVVEYFVGPLVGAISTVIGWFSSIVSTVVSVGTSVVSSVSGFIGSIIQFFADLPGKIKDLFVGAGKWLYDAGKDIVNGLIDGVMSMFGAIGDMVSNVGSAIWDGITGFFGISSPSRLMRDTVGVHIPAGIGEGMERGTKYALDAAHNVSIDTANAFNGLTDIGNSGGEYDIAPSLPVSTVQAQSNTNTFSPNMTVTFGDINSDVDVDLMIEKLEKMLINAYSAVLN